MPTNSQHGKDTVITVATKDISAYTTTSKLTRQANLHGKTGYGEAGERNRGGLVKFTFTAEGWYDTTASTGTDAVMNGQEGVTQTITRKVQGTGTGKPLQTFSAVLTEYVVTDPANDIVTWSATWTGDGVVADSTQP